ncbi:class I mannose-6-phosphate isomerase, partial [Streptomyces sp. NPDC001226]
MYRLDPRYTPAPRTVLATGWQAIADQLPPAGAVVAIDGPPSVDWDLLADRLVAAWPGEAVRLLDVREHYAPPAEVRRRTVRPEDAADPYYCKLAEGTPAHDTGYWSLGSGVGAIPVGHDTPVPPNP